IGSDVADFQCGRWRRSFCGLRRRFLRNHWREQEDRCQRDSDCFLHAVPFRYGSLFFPHTAAQDYPIFISPSCQNQVNSYGGTPTPRMSLGTVNDIFFAVIERDQPRVMMNRHTIDWVPISSPELYRNVAGVALALETWGISRGDRIAVLAENRPEWSIADFAS